MSKCFLTVKDPLVGATSGLLSPEGKFYRCEYGCHTDLAREIAIADKMAMPAGDEPLDWMLDNKWIHLQSRIWRRTSCVRVIKDMEGLTQKQLDFVFEWCEQFKLDVPWKVGQPVADHWK